MQAKSSSAVLVSLALHALVVGIIFFTTVYVAQRDRDQPHIIELVAGPPTAPEALIAPALGNTTAKLKLDIPKIELPPEAEEPEPAPPQLQPESPPVPEKKPVKPTPTPEKPKPVATFKEELKQKAKVSYQEYLKKHPTPKPSTQPAPPRTGKVPKIDAQGIANGVKVGSTNNVKGGGGGKALTREEQSLYDTYFSFLINALKEAHEPPSGVSDQLETRVTFEITASGTVLNPRIAKSSGNREFDESVLAAFRRVKSIGPTPDRKAGTFSVTFKMRDE